MTCKNCYHYAACRLEISLSFGTDYKTDKMYNDMEKRCENFKDKAKIIEIPDIEIGRDEYFLVTKIDGKYRFRIAKYNEVELYKLKLPPNI